MQKKTNTSLADDVLKIDAAAEVARISSRMRDILRTDLRRRGLVIAISGGVDSAVCAALCVQAVGASKVFGLLLPERDSSPVSSQRGRQVAEQLGIPYVVEDIAPTLEAIGCYRWRDDAIRKLFPDYGSSWKTKIVIAGGGEAKFSYFKLVVQAPDGKISEARLGSSEYMQIVASTSYKQRIRKTIEYFHADRLNYAVVGTPNRLEYDQGFFVKNGDGSADLKPIAHLYKTQVYALARHLKLPEEICTAAPTTDTYSMPQGQDEFYFSLPYQKMDVALWALNHGVEPGVLAERLGMTAQQAEYVYGDIRAKRAVARYLHSPPLSIDPVINRIE